MMRHKIFLAALLAGASPALATGSLECRSSDGSGLIVRGAVGHVVGSPLVTASLEDNEALLSTAGEAPNLSIARSWIDAAEIRVDLADADLLRLEAELRARRTADNLFVGTLSRDGQSRPVRCTLD